MESEGKKPFEADIGSSEDVNQIAERLYRERKENGFNLGSYGVQAEILESGIQPEDGKDFIAMWAGAQIGKYGGTELSSWSLTPIIDALNTRRMKNTWLRSSQERVLRILGAISFRIEEQAPEVSDSKGLVLERAIAKQLISEMLTTKDKDKSKDKDKDKSRDYGSYSVDLTKDEAKELFKHKELRKTINARCNTMGNLGNLLNMSVSNRLEVIGAKALLRNKDLLSGVVSGKISEADVMSQLTFYEKQEQLISNELEAKLEVINETSASDIETEEWGNLTRAFLGLSSIFNGCNQWLTNQSDLEPIGRMWENQGRMVEVHPNYLKKMAEQFPSFGEAFRGIAAICSGKYALGDNGEVYPSGVYGLGYVNSAGEIVDVDEAKKRGIKPLERNEIWVNGSAVKIDSVGFREIKIGKDKFGKEKSVISGGKVEIDGKQVKIYSRNMLYETGAKDNDVDEFVEKITAFVKGKDKTSQDFHVDLGVALARDFYEMTMLSNWNGVPRDSHGKPYYVEYVGLTEELWDEKKKWWQGAPEWKRDYETISSDPESEAVRTGVPLCGWDEASLYPYWVNDFGKLTLTKFKQTSELFKGRKHGLYPLISYLPESLAQPMLTIDRHGAPLRESSKDPFNYDIGDIISGRVKMTDVFENMPAVGRFKTFWLDIAKGIAVYEFISSNFIGDKDVTKADQDMIALMMQPRNFEGLNKNIDLSLLYVDPWEAARLKVNIVTAALAAVSQDLRMEEFLGVDATGSEEGRLEKFLFDIKKGDVEGVSNVKSLESALRQLKASRFVGGSEEIMHILKKITDYKKTGGESNLCFTVSEFKSVFGKDYLDNVWKKREERRKKVFSR